MNGKRGSSFGVAALSLLSHQRSHVLFVLSDSKLGNKEDFLAWYKDGYRKSIDSLANILRAQHYQQHSVDITTGRFPRPPFQYLGIYEISIDGAPAASDLIQQITILHQECGAALAPATWIYFPVSEKVGRPAKDEPSLLTLAFANPLLPQRTEFLEWYSTRHIRHALNIPALVSGQCFARSTFQMPGALAADFELVAIYEQEGSPESIIESFASLPEEALQFPSLDLSRFAESVYSPLA